MFFYNYLKVGIVYLQLFKAKFVGLFSEVSHSSYSTNYPIIRFFNLSLNITLKQFPWLLLFFEFVALALNWEGTLVLGNFFSAYLMLIIEVTQLEKWGFSDKLKKFWTMKRNCLCIKYSEKKKNTEKSFSEITFLDSICYILQIFVWEDEKRFQCLVK